MARVQFDGDDADGHGIFYHTKRTRELDELLGDVYHKILGELVQRSFGLFGLSLAHWCLSLTSQTLSSTSLSFSTRLMVLRGLHSVIFWRRHTRATTEQFICGLPHPLDISFCGHSTPAG
jgi:hypothetical protein